jgi:hypothetical protein
VYRLHSPVSNRVNVPDRYNTARQFHDMLSSDHTKITVAVHGVGHSASCLVAIVFAAIRTSHHQ